MSVKVEEFLSERIVIVSIIAPIKFPADVDTPLEAGATFKKKAGVPCCRILDFTNSNLQFSEMVLGAGMELGKPGGFWDKDIFHILIGTNEWVKFGVESIQEQDQYKGANIKGLVATREEALKMAHSLLA